jgi:glyoxylase I family protein
MNKPPFRIEQLDHVVLRVYDVPTMLAFYCDVLGCNVERRQDEIGLVQLRAGHSLIDLVSIDGKLGRHGGAGPGTGGHNMDHLCLSVDGYDEQAILAYLKDRGVHVGDVGSRYGAKGEGPSIYLFDPQGNMVELKGPPSIPGMPVQA